jgi:broad specificity phosphatase PhoE
MSLEVVFETQSRRRDGRDRVLGYGDPGPSRSTTPRVQLRRDERDARIDAWGGTSSAHRSAVPGGESWRQAVDRVGGFLKELAETRDGERVLVIGHVATRWALDHFVSQVPLEELVTAPFDWRERLDLRAPVELDNDLGGWWRAP